MNSLERLEAAISVLEKEIETFNQNFYATGMITETELRQQKILKYNLSTLKDTLGVYKMELCGSTDQEDMVELDGECFVEMNLANTIIGEPLEDYLGKISDEDFDDYDDYDFDDDDSYYPTYGEPWGYSEYDKSDYEELNSSLANLFRKEEPSDEEKTIKEAEKVLEDADIPALKVKAIEMSHKIAEQYASITTGGGKLTICMKVDDYFGKIGFPSSLEAFIGSVKLFDDDAFKISAPTLTKYIEVGEQVLNIFNGIEPVIVEPKVKEGKSFKKQTFQLPANTPLQVMNIFKNFAPLKNKNIEEIEKLIDFPNWISEKESDNPDFVKGWDRLANKIRKILNKDSKGDTIEGVDGSPF